MGRQDWQWEVGSWLLRPAPPGTEPDTAPRPPGLFSTIMRDLANITHDGPKWIVLDGDIDPMWIESLNTVMDDNKVTGLPDPRAGPGPQSRGGGAAWSPAQITMDGEPPLARGGPVGRRPACAQLRCLGRRGQW